MTMLHITGSVTDRAVYAFKLLLSCLSTLLVFSVAASFVESRRAAQQGWSPSALLLCVLALLSLLGLHGLCLYSWHCSAVDAYSLLTCICYLYSLSIASDHAKRVGLGGEASASEKVNIFTNGVHYPVSYFSEKGGRPYQEDRHAALRGVGAPDSSLYAVYDGHGGSRAAQFCKEKLLHYAISDPTFASQVSRALSEAFVRCDAEFSRVARAQLLSDGTTACVACIHGRRIFVANAGDSRSIIAQRGGRSRPMSEDHKPDREDEERRIRALGGKVVHWGRWRVEGVLAVSRAIGDVSLQPFVTCVPEVVEKVISSEDEYLVIASDGVWDVLRNDDVARLVAQAAAYDFATTAKSLCAEALLMGSTDNVTAMVVDLRGDGLATSKS